MLLRTYALQLYKIKKALITANKALIAKYGKDLADLAELNNLFFSFEASVAGGIPILKLIREGLDSK